MDDVSHNVVTYGFCLGSRELASICEPFGACPKYCSVLQLSQRSRENAVGYSSPIALFSARGGFPVSVSHPPPDWQRMQPQANTVILELVSASARIAHVFLEPHNIKTSLSSQSFRHPLSCSSPQPPNILSALVYTYSWKCRNAFSSFLARPTEP